MKIKNNKLYLGSWSAENLIEKFGSPLYVYEENVVVKKYKELKNSIG